MLASRPGLNKIVWFETINQKISTTMTNRVWDSLREFVDIFGFNLKILKELDSVWLTPRLSSVIIKLHHEKLQMNSTNFKSIQILVCRNFRSEAFENFETGLPILANAENINKTKFVNRAKFTDPTTQRDGFKQQYAHHTMVVENQYWRVKLRQLEKAAAKSGVPLHRCFWSITTVICQWLNHPQATRRLLL